MKDGCYQRQGLMYEAAPIYFGKDATIPYVTILKRERKYL